MVQRITRRARAAVDRGLAFLIGAGAAHTRRRLATPGAALRPGRTGVSGRRAASHRTQVARGRRATLPLFGARRATTRRRTRFALERGGVASEAGTALLCQAAATAAVPFLAAASAVDAAGTTALAGRVARGGEGLAERASTGAVYAREPGATWFVRATTANIGPLAAARRAAVVVTAEVRAAVVGIGARLEGAPAGGRAAQATDAISVAAVGRGLACRAVESATGEAHLVDALVTRAARNVG